MCCAQMKACVKMTFTRRFVFARCLAQSRLCVRGSAEMGINMKFHVIAIEREYASGGREIGRKVAERLGIPCYGREILEMAAKRKGTSVEYLEAIEEKATGSLLYSMYVMANLTKGGPMSNEDDLFLTESEIIGKLTQTPAVIVGRCAAHSLRERKDVLRVYIHSGADMRRERAISRYEVDPAVADSWLKRADKRRAGYYKANTGKNWNDINNYHLVLDSGLLGTDKCVDILESCCR